MDSSITLSLGGRELLIRLLDCSNFSGAGPKEFSFKVTRIRCWRLVNSVEDMLSRRSCVSPQIQKLELSFEYLMNKDNLRWITIESDQAVLISMSLQGMVDELLMKRKGQKYGSPSAIPVTPSGSSNSCTNGTTQSDSSQKDSLFSLNGHMNGNHNSGVKYNVRKEIANDAFDGIGDDDL
jgi:sorting nexin-17